MTAVIEARGLVKRYADVVALSREHAGSFAVGIEYAAAMFGRAAHGDGAVAAAPARS